MDNSILLGFTCKEIVNLLAIFVGPIISVIITIWYQNRYVQKQAKLNIFDTLSSMREQTNPIPLEFVKALNNIDIIYKDNDRVLNARDKYYDGLCGVNRHNDTKILLADLLSEMSIAVGYDIKPTKYLRTYTPQQHLDNNERRNQLEEQMKIYFSTLNTSYQENVRQSNID